MDDLLDRVDPDFKIINESENPVVGQFEIRNKN
jgi:hypothetical protein